MSFDICVQFSLPYGSTDETLYHEFERSVDNHTDVEPTIMDILKRHREPMLYYRSMANLESSPRSIRFIDIDENDSEISITVTNHVNNDEIIDSFDYSNIDKYISGELSLFDESSSIGEFIRSKNISKLIDEVKRNIKSLYLNCYLSDNEYFEFKMGINHSTQPNVSALVIGINEYIRSSDLLGVSIDLTLYDTSDNVYVKQLNYREFEELADVNKVNLKHQIKVYASVLPMEFLNYIGITDDVKKYMGNFN